jgi:hypothetical protein
MFKIGDIVRPKINGTFDTAIDYEVYDAGKDFLKVKVSGKSLDKLTKQEKMCFLQSSFLAAGSARYTISEKLELAKTALLETAYTSHGSQYLHCTHCGAKTAFDYDIQMGVGTEKRIVHRPDCIISILAEPCR